MFTRSFISELFGIPTALLSKLGLEVYGFGHVDKRQLRSTIGEVS